MQSFNFCSALSCKSRSENLMVKTDADLVHPISKHSSSPLLMDQSDPVGFPAKYHYDDSETTSGTPPSLREEAFRSVKTGDLLNCGRCDFSFRCTLDVWMDHLCEFHPMPEEWPSTRALNTNVDRPYSAVVGSHKKRKSNAIPRPLNSFMIFAHYIRRETLRWFPEAHNVRISQRVGCVWRQMHDTIREQYSREAVRLQRLHSVEFPDYKYQPKKRIRQDSSTNTRPVSVDKTLRTLGVYMKRDRDSLNEPTSIDQTITSESTTSETPSIMLDPTMTSPGNQKRLMTELSWNKTQVNDVLTVLVAGDSHLQLRTISSLISPWNSSVENGLITTPSVLINTPYGPMLTEPLRVITQSQYPQSGFYELDHTAQFNCDELLSEQNSDLLNSRSTSDTPHTGNFTPSITSFSPESTEPDYHLSDGDLPTITHGNPIETELKAIPKLFHVDYQIPKARHDVTTTVWTTTKSPHFHLVNPLTSAELETSVGFENIETNGHGPSLAELSHLILFDSEATPTNGSIIKADQCLMSNTSTENVRTQNCIKLKPEEIGCLPSIESWVQSTPSNDCSTLISHL